MKKLLLLFSIMLISIGCLAYDFNIDGIYYNITSEEERTVEITHNGKWFWEASNVYSGNVVIPEYVQYEGRDYKVTSIGGRAFYNSPDLESVNTGDGVVTISSFAFMGSSIESLYVGRNVRSMGTMAFSNCFSLEHVYIKDVDGWCSIRADYNSGSPMYPTMSLSWEQAKHLYLNEEEINGDIVIGDGVDSIAHFAFYDCIGLTSVSLSESVVAIGRYAFSGCSNITSINIPAGVTLLDYSALERCSSLTQLHLPDALRIIDNGAVSRCSGLTSIIVPDKVTRIGKYAFHYGTGLNEIILGKSLTLIDDYAFQYCSNLKSIRIHAQEPPYCSSYQPFDNEVYSQAVLYVPRGCKQAYEKADVWKRFSTIVEVDGVREVSSLAELEEICLLDDSIPFVLSFDNMLVTYQGANHTYVSDGERGMMLFGSSPLHTGERVAGSISGVAWLYHGTPEVLVDGESFQASVISAGNDVPCKKVTASDWVQRPLEYINQYIEVEGVKFADSYNTYDYFRTLPFQIGDYGFVLFNLYNRRWDIDAGKYYRLRGIATIFDDDIELTMLESGDLQVDNQTGLIDVRLSCEDEHYKEWSVQGIRTKSSSNGLYISQGKKYIRMSGGR